MQTTGYTQEVEGHFARKRLKEPAHFWKKFFGQMKPRWTCTNVMGREEYRQEEKQLWVQIISYHLSNMVEAPLWHGHVWLPVKLPVFTDDISAGRSISMNS